MQVIFPAFLLAGLVLPGYFAARLLDVRLRWASAFVLSLAALFHCVFWTGVLGVPVTLWPVLGGLVAFAAAAAALRRNKAVPAGKAARAPWSRDEVVLLAMGGLIVAIVLVRCARSPLLGYDASFRWDFLAQRIFELNRFSFYPPVTPADFRVYFYPDGIPPLVQFTRWWTYESAQEYIPALTSLFVAAQFAATLAFVYGAAAALFSRSAGVLATALLASSPLFLLASILGQETGMTAVAVAATVYFIVAARRPGDTRAMAAAGIAAGVCALSREYGWVAVGIGVIALLWRRQSLRAVAVFAAAGVLTAGPWYVRNWIRTGNPVYSLKVAGFPVNPVHDGIMRHYAAVAGVSHWTAAQWAATLGTVLGGAVLTILAGVPGAFRGVRERGYLLVAAVLLIGVWLVSIAYTSGGMPARVLTPALAVLAITGAGLAERPFGTGRWRQPILIVLALGMGWSGITAAVFPYEPSDVAHWCGNPFPLTTLPFEERNRDALAQVAPPNSRILSDNADLHAALSGKGIEVVPVWSPEVRFLLSASPEEASRRLQELGIRCVAYYPKSLNTEWLVSASPFYAALTRQWTQRVDVSNTLQFYAPAAN